MTSFVVDVPGTPRPQGSQRLIHNRTTGHTVAKSDPQLAEWRNQLVKTLEDRTTATGWVTVKGPVEVILSFRFGRPKSHSKKRRLTDLGIKGDGPDVDKLARTVLDALAIAGIMTDDRQVSFLAAEKTYTDDRYTPGVTVTVRLVRDTPEATW